MGSNLGRSAAQAAGLVYSLPFLPHFRFRRGRRPGGQMDGGEPAARGKSAVGTGRERFVEVNKGRGTAGGSGQTWKRQARSDANAVTDPHCRAGSDSVWPIN